MSGANASGPSFQVRLFGGPAVVGPEGAVRLSRYQLALVTLVFATGVAGISRARIAWLLWEEDDSARARHRIRQLLHSVSRRVGRPLIRAEADKLLPLHGEAACDTAELTRALDGGELTAAAELLHLGFGVHLDPPTGELDDWLSSKGAGWVADLRSRASAKWDDMTAAGLWNDARDGAEALYLLHPDDPRMVEKVLEARAHVGKIGSAEAAYVAYLESLGPGQEPASCVETMMKRIRSLQRRQPASRGRSERERPFVGRQDALELGRRAFEGVELGRFEFVLVSGESGIGKTRVLEQLRREALLKDFRCLHAQPVELERRIPLNPLLDALSSTDLGPHLKALGNPWRAVIGSLLPPGLIDEPTGEVPPIQESRLPRRLLDALSLLLRRLVDERPTLLFLDDLHWADATTVTALQFIQRRWASGPLGIIASVRPEVLTPRDPAAQYLTESEGLTVRHVRLAEFSSSEAHDLVRQLAGSHFDATVTDRLCALAGYHPLYLTEITKDYLAEELRLPMLPADEVTIPMSLKQILGARLEHISATAMKVAGLLAVRARPMRMSALSHLTGLPVDRCADCVEELHRWRLVELDRDSVYVAHELFRSALYQHLSEARRAILHRAIAEHIAAEQREPPAGELAIHYARAGEAELAARHGWSAATRALEGGAVAEAAHFFDLVIENEADPSRRAEATAELARALHLNREIRRANPLLELAASRLRAVGNGSRALRMDIRRVEGLAEEGSTTIHDLVDRLALIKKEARAVSDWEAVALALDVELHLLHHAGDVPGVHKLFAEMREVGEQGCQDARAITCGGLALNVLFSDGDEALRAAQEGVALTLDRRSHRLRSLLRLLLVLHYRGMFQQPNTREIVAEARALARTSGDLLLRFSVESNLAVASLDAGDLDRAEVLLERSTAMLGSADMDLYRFNQSNNIGELALAKGDFRRAKAAYLEAGIYLGATTPSYANDLVNAGLGLCALESGHLEEARRRESEIPEQPTSWYYDPTTILAFRARVLDRRGKRQVATDLLEASAQDLEDRLVLAWIKIRILEARMLQSDDPTKAGLLAHEALERAHSLNLCQRESELRNLLARIDGADH